MRRPALAGLGGHRGEPAPILHKDFQMVIAAASASAAVGALASTASSILPDARFRGEIVGGICRVEGICWDIAAHARASCRRAGTAPRSPAADTSAAAATGIKNDAAPPPAIGWLAGARGRRQAA